ncbi:unnamed protein product, partial [marine sediment metagenome]
MAGLRRRTSPDFPVNHDNQDNARPNLQVSGSSLLRRRLTVRGRVQGVGFRPFVYRLARELCLAGSVRNDMQGATVEVEGDGCNIDDFVRRLQSDLPVLASITSLSV